MKAKRRHIFGEAFLGDAPIDFQRAMWYFIQGKTDWGLCLLSNNSERGKGVR